MTVEPGQSIWDAPSPLGATHTTVRAAELAAARRADRAQVVVNNSHTEPLWLKIDAVRTLAGLLAGPDAHARFDKLRTDIMELAEEQDDEDMRCSLTAISYAEAYERGAHLTLDALEDNAEFTDRAIAYAAACLAGHVVAYLAGPDTNAVFQRLRYQNGLT